MKQLECFLYDLFKVSNTSHQVYWSKCFKVLFLKMSEKMIFVIPACIGSSWLQVINLSLELGNYSQKCWLRFPVILTHSWGRPALTRSSNVHWADPLLLVCCKSNKKSTFSQIRNCPINSVTTGNTEGGGREGGCQSSYIWGFCCLARRSQSFHDK